VVVEPPVPTTNNVTATDTVTFAFGLKGNPALLIS
jgi:hypothetical protein